MLLSIGPLGTNFSEISIKIQKFSCKKLHLKILSAKWRISCPGEDQSSSEQNGCGFAGSIFVSDFFYPRPFWPTGIVIACVCVCICVSVNFCLSSVHTITHHTFQLESPDLDEKMQNILLKVPIDWGGDWAWPSMSNLTSFRNAVYLHRFCVFEIFVRRAKKEFIELFSTSHMAPHTFWFLYMHAMDRAMDCETV